LNFDTLNIFAEYKNNKKGGEGDLIEEPTQTLMNISRFPQHFNVIATVNPYDIIYRKIQLSVM
jgi:hypothetical protein